MRRAAKRAGILLWTYLKWECIPSPSYVSITLMCLHLLLRFKVHFENFPRTHIPAFLVVLIARMLAFSTRHNQLQPTDRGFHTGPSCYLVLFAIPAFPQVPMVRRFSRNYVCLLVTYY